MGLLDGEVAKETALEGLTLRSLTIVFGVGLLLAFPGFFLLEGVGMATSSARGWFVPVYYTVFGVDVGALLICPLGLLATTVLAIVRRVQSR